MKPLPEAISHEAFTIYQSISAVLAAQHTSCGDIMGVISLMTSDIVHSSAGDIPLDAILADIRAMTTALLDAAPVGTFDPATGEPTSIH